MRSDDEKRILVRKDNSDDDTLDPTAPFYEQQSFDSIWQALTWKQIRTRIPICFRKTLRSRYMFANLIYLGYAIGMLITSFHSFDESSITSIGESFSNIMTTPSISILDQPVHHTLLTNRLYLVFNIIHLISAFTYIWAWRDQSWLNIIMIPEYLNVIAATLYIWSAMLYPKQDTLGGSYTIAVHRIEMAASIIELIASFGWIMSWYMTYIRTLGRGFTFDDPDTTAYVTTTTASFMYVIYYIRINLHPELYNTDDLYVTADILYFIAACFYIFAALRDDHWFWFLPLAGQYCVAPGKIHIETTKVLPCYGKSPVLITDLCVRRRTENEALIKEQKELHVNKNSSI
ncbi:hypothetical protein I4U23_027836 [Adineta vaga]|nr:hypothetical protein I4U23_027836 [Adineta vaga]